MKVCIYWDSNQSSRSWVGTLVPVDDDQDYLINWYWRERRQRLRIAR